jgi:hypothetical protein
VCIGERNHRWFTVLLLMGGLGPTLMTVGCVTIIWIGNESNLLIWGLAFGLGY